jgi:hypothetical protein
MPCVKQNNPSILDDLHSDANVAQFLHSAKAFGASDVFFIGAIQSKPPSARGSRTPQKIDNVFEAEGRFRPGEAVHPDSDQDRGSRSGNSHDYASNSVNCPRT